MKDLPSGYTKSLIRMVLTGFVIVGALNYGLTAIDYNLIEVINHELNNYFNKDLHFNIILYILIASYVTPSNSKFIL
jgi:uncharacterized membrane protein YuzA (DUF378 family)